MSDAIDLNELDLHMRAPRWAPTVVFCDNDLE
jgi:hypothetical protein